MMGHYYDDKGNLFDCDIRKARSAGLYPSVNTILGVLDKGGLNIWKQREAVKAAFAYPFNPFDDMKKQIGEVIESAYTSEAADLGTSMHSFIADYFKREGAVHIAEEEPYHTLQLKFIELAETHLWEPRGIEMPLVDPEQGFAGRVDWWGYLGEDLVIVDWKTQGVKGDKPIIYDDWLLEISGYRRLMPMPTSQAFKFIAVVINTTPGADLGKIWMHEFSQEDAERGVERFWYLLQYFRSTKKI